MIWQFSKETRKNMMWYFKEINPAESTFRWPCMPTGAGTGDVVR